MNDHDALLRAICENPREDTPRLAFADWLDENGQPDRAAFIRTDIAMSLRDEWDAERIRWEEGLTLANLYPRPWASQMFPHLPRETSWVGLPITRRGFPYTIQFRYPEVLLKENPQLLRQHPIEAIAFAPHPPDLRELGKVPGFHRIRALSFQASRYSAAHLAPFLRAAPATLEELTFSNRSIRSEGVAAVFSSPVFPTLTQLRFSQEDSKVGRAVLDSLTTVGNMRLHALILEGVLTGASSVEMLAARRIPASVRTLGLRANRISAERMANLAASPGLTPLRRLDLSMNAIGNEGATALFTSPQLAGLKVLDLSYCMVGDEALRALLENSPLADGLNLLNLTGSPASADMKQAVKERMGDRVRL